VQESVNELDESALQLATFGNNAKGANEKGREEHTIGDGKSKMLVRRYVTLHDLNTYDDLDFIATLNTLGEASLTGTWAGSPNYYVVKGS